MTAPLSPSGECWPLQGPWKFLARAEGAPSTSWFDTRRAAGEISAPSTAARTR